MKWYGHVRSMNEERLPQKSLQWCSPRRRKGRPRNSWMQEVTTGTRKKGINNIQWIEMENEENKTLGSDVKTLMLSTYFFFKLSISSKDYN